MRCPLALSATVSVKPFFKDLEEFSAFYIFNLPSYLLVLGTMYVFILSVVGLFSHTATQSAVLNYHVEHHTPV